MKRLTLVEERDTFVYEIDSYTIKDHVRATWKGYDMSITKSPPSRKQKSRSTGKRTAKGSRSLKLRIIIPLLVLLIAAGFLVFHFATREVRQIDNPKIAALAKLKLPNWVEKDLLPKDANSRRGELLEDLNGIVVHYVGNPGTSAKQNRNYFSNPDATVNAHFVIGLEGEIVQCLPLEEKSSASNDRNRDTISIEVCHPDETGVFNDQTYQSLLRLTAWLCEKEGLTADQVIRHYDVTGKACPIYFVEHPEAWEVFRTELSQDIKP